MVNGVNKRRSAVAVAAWMRSGAGSHGGPKKPDYDETEEGFDDYLDEKEEQYDDEKGHVPVRTGQEPHGSCRRYGRLD